ncbi:unnamed protein product [Owenia fusiformis]|uniref:Uncharacterized protein n=1 Tax=Owenia fusiformis TaxID=6347 RepID=A0A8J1TH57_OWEFU|nr:unnamed protein product [Owenia fusiformis]
MRSKKDHRITFSQSFICGAFAGVSSRTLTAPLDVVKILSQVGTLTTKRGFLRTFPNLYKQEGLGAFWKGNLVGCLRLLPYSAIQFAAFQKIKLLLANDQGRLSPFSAMIAGSSAGIIATVAIYPTDMVKTRLIVQTMNRNVAPYQGIIDAFRVIYAREGIAAFYKGMSTSILGVVPFAGATFVTYELLDRLWHVSRSQLSPLQHFINGSVASAVALTASFPFDTIRKKLQAHSTVLPDRGGVNVEFDGMVDAFRQTVRRNGIFGLWSGWIPAVIKIVPYGGLMFVTFEASKRYCLYYNGYTESPLTLHLKSGVDQSLTPGKLKYTMEMQEKYPEDLAKGK